ncbi:MULTISPECIES: PAS domain-containing sensor histidine kinase [unclassified Flavobacterium]|uniref:sensor histidine kinase n=1 Tax=unclassified Flavobacterium TaxID=196869 RepID=UPI001F1295B8|nr:MULTISPECIES: HAMP domain-containing sensor histidine kinase [unclassified Flavobacterium]UMY66068.1 HAMP domain-containing histidine kinase [Flavobacterium sp. HJ-32-4]
MDLSERRNRARWVIVITSLVVVSLIVWNTYSFFQIFKGEERQKMELWASAQTSLQNLDPNNELDPLVLDVLQSNTTIPAVQMENGRIISQINVPEDISKNSKKMAAFIDRLKQENAPIVNTYAEGKTTYVYYGNSSRLNQLKYYPLALLLIIVLFVTLVYNFYRSNKMAIENKLWAGMAKETAHQIGTPLSSLMGWLEIMKADQMDAVMVAEIEKDILRLQSITDRFSKIGSEPVLEECDIIAETEQAYDYLRARFSAQIQFTFAAPEHPIKARINRALHGWTIENLVKNAIDAMRGRGALDVTIIDEHPFVKIYVSDTGKGIPKKQFRKVFEPGFTTKKRGWGLGLSLTKRIVEEYHKGRIKVARSEKGKGTTMQVALPKT